MRIFRRYTRCLASLKPPFIHGILMINACSKWHKYSQMQNALLTYTKWTPETPKRLPISLLNSRWYIAHGVCSLNPQTLSSISCFHQTFWNTFRGANQLISVMVEVTLPQQMTFCPPICYIIEFGSQQHESLSWTSTPPHPKTKQNKTKQNAFWYV